MNNITQSNNAIEFKNYLSKAERILIMIFGLLPLLAPYELIIKPNYSEFPILFKMLNLIISIGAIAVSSFLIYSSFFALNKIIQINSDDKLIIYKYRSAFKPFCTINYSFSKIESINLKAIEWESRADTYTIALKIKDRKRDIDFGGFTSKEEAERYLSILNKIINMKC